MAYSAKTDWKTGDYVRPEDMNRMEGGIKQAHENKVDKDLSNVTDAAFANKAKTSGIDMPALNDITYYVSPNGNDTTGDGTGDRPFKTLQKAVDSFPYSNPVGSIYYIRVMPGTYDGFVLRSNKNIWISADSDNVYIGRILLYTGFVHIQNNITLNDCVSIFNTANLIVQQATIDRTSGSGEPAIICQYGGRLIVTDKISINNVQVGVDCLFADVIISHMVMTGGTTGISCNCGQVSLGKEEISADTKYVVTSSGRVFVGSETITQS